MGLFGKKKVCIYIDYYEPTRMHPSAQKGSDTTIDSVARILEAKYHLLKHFTDIYGLDMVELLVKEWKRDQSKKKRRCMHKLEEFLKNKWRTYIVNAEHGIKTQASAKRGSEPFVDTGAYFKNLRVKLDLLIG